MAKYFRTDISNMREAGVGGKLYSVVIEKDIPNGFIGFLGDYEEGSTEVKTLETPASEKINGKSLPVIVMKPEIEYRDEVMTDRALGIHMNKGGVPVPAIQFKEGDGVDLSEDYFDLTGKGNGQIEVGDKFAIEESDEAGKQLKYSAGVPEDCTCYFRVIGVKNSCIAVFVGADGSRLPKPYKMVQLELVLA